MKVASMEMRDSRPFAFAGIDTGIVLFFLGLEYGRAVHVLSLEGAVVGLTMSMVLILPYFLPSAVEKPSFAFWCGSRAFIALSAVLLGMAFNMGLGSVLPESLGFMPMTFLIAAAMISGYFQFYGLMKLRLAK